MDARNGAVFNDYLLQRASDVAAGLAVEGHAFVERREDLTLDAVAGEPIRVRFVATAGWARTEGGAGSFGSDGDPGPGGMLDVEGARRWVERLRGLLGPEAAITYVTAEQRIAVVRSGRVPVFDRRKGARVRIEVRSRHAGGAVADAVWRPGREPDPGVLAASALGRARQRTSPLPPPEGALPVVFAPGVAGIVVHELVGHALEADVMERSASWLSGQVGEVASRALRVIDDPRRGRVPWKFDDTGEAVTPIALLEEGRVVQSLGRGRLRRASFSDPLLPRMGCTFVAAGSATVEEALRGIATGLYVRRLEAASVDPRTGRATFRVTDADLVRDGEITTPVQACLLSMTASQALRAFEAIADDVQYDSCLGTCFKSGQPMAVSVGAPTCRLGMARVHA